MTEVNRSCRGPPFRHSVSVTGCQGGRQVKGSVGTDDAGVPMFAPNVNRWSKPRKKSTYQGTPFAMASWVNAGSESTNALCGILTYSSRQNQEPPERLTSRSASAHQVRTCSAESP